MGIEEYYPRLYHNGRHYGKLSLPIPPRLLIFSVQAQFIISPDRLFAEKGAITKINYHDRFKQYKKLIVKNINSPQMKVLMAQLDAQLFRTESKVNQASPAVEEESDDDEDIFSRAFQEQVTLSAVYFIFHYPNNVNHPPRREHKGRICHASCRTTDQRPGSLSAHPSQHPGPLPVRLSRHPGPLPVCSSRCPGPLPVCLSRCLRPLPTCPS
jgi:hypothetical protein